MTAPEDRRSDGYEPRFDIDLAAGVQAELFVVNIIKSLGTHSIETKLDARYEDTGNIYVEYACLRRNKWRPSGIATTEADLWVFVLSMNACCFVISTDALKAAAKEKYEESEWFRRKQSKGSHPTKGVILPVDWLLQYATKFQL